METVRIVEDNKNYIETFKALSVLDTILSDGWFDENISDETIKLIPYLFDPLTLSLLDDYIHDTVKSYIRRKRNIVINIFGVINVPDFMPGLVFEDKVKFECTTSSDWNPNKELSRKVGKNKKNKKSEKRVLKIKKTKKTKK